MFTPLAPDLTFKPVDPAFARVKLISSFFLGVPALVAAVVVTILTWESFRWAALGIVVVVGLWLWYVVLVWRRVRAMGYAELEEELVLCRGIMFRALEVIPYGRMQQVTVSSGPLLKRYGLASVTLVTAAAGTNGAIPGVPQAEAERLRTKLTALGTAEMEGL